MLKTAGTLVLLILFSFTVSSQNTGQVPSPGIAANTPAGVNRTELIAFARQYLSIPYKRAGSDPKKGFDCSGLVNYVFKHFNVSLPRSSREFKKLGTALKPEEFKVGDVVVFYGFRDRKNIGHVGIICEANGMNSKFIHASSGSAHSVTISELNSRGYRARFYKCIDVL
jgi:cell wall-associated NlpC family hydrolase